jgi:hypothetical protein
MKHVGVFYRTAVRALARAARLCVVFLSPAPSFERELARFEAAVSQARAKNDRWLQAHPSKDL